MCRGRGSLGAWQYGAVALHTPVKTPPMGPGQLWPTYTALWAITSIMTHRHTHTRTHTYYSNPGNSVWLPGCLLVLSVRNYLSLSLFRSVSRSHTHTHTQSTTFLFCTPVIINLFCIDYHVGAYSALVYTRLIPTLHYVHASFSSTHACSKTPPFHLIRLH